MNKIYHINLLILLVLLSSGCTFKRNELVKSVKSLGSNNAYYRDSNSLKDGKTNLDKLPLFTDEASISDIIIPIGVTLYNLSESKYESQRKLSIQYISDQDMDELINFYRAEMECMGWYESMVNRAADSCLVFQKTFKLCVIFFRYYDNKTQVSIYSDINKYII